MTIDTPSAVRAYVQPTEQDAKLPEELEPLRKPVDGIRPDPTNPKLHDGEQVAAIAASFLEFGQDQPIVVDRDGVIAKGEGRYLAGTTVLGWKTMAIVYTDDDQLGRVRRNLADNRTHDMTGYDNDALLRLARESSKGDAGMIPGFTEDFLKDLNLYSGDPPEGEDGFVTGYGEPHEADFWPMIRVKVPPETFALYNEIMGEDDEDVIATAGRFLFILEAFMEHMGGEKAPVQDGGE